MFVDLHIAALAALLLQLTGIIERDVEFWKTTPSMQLLYGRVMLPINFIVDDIFEAVNPK